jgi:repressor LexA
MSGPMQDADTFPMPRGILGPAGDLFLMKVHGDPEWTEAPISDGDWVVVRTQRDADWDDVVVAWIDGSPVLTSYERLAPGQGTIAGKVVSVLHRLGT